MVTITVMNVLKEIFWWLFDIKRVWQFLAATDMPFYCDSIHKTQKTRNVGQCPTWWPPCRI